MQVEAPSPGTRLLIDQILAQEKYDKNIWNSLHLMGWDSLLYIELQWRSVPNWQDHYPNWLRIYRCLRRAFHKTPEYRAFRSEVLERDGCCTNVKCQTKSKLQVHHIKSWYGHPRLRLDLNNCKTLCGWCHKQEPSSQQFP